MSNAQVDRYASNHERLIPVVPVSNHDVIEDTVESVASRYVYIVRHGANRMY